MNDVTQAKHRGWGIAEERLAPLPTHLAVRIEDNLRARHRQRRDMFHAMDDLDTIAVAVSSDGPQAARGRIGDRSDRGPQSLGDRAQTAFGVRSRSGSDQAGLIRFLQDEKIGPPFGAPEIDTSRLFGADRMAEVGHEPDSLLQIRAAEHGVVHIPGHRLSNILQVAFKIYPDGRLRAPVLKPRPPYRSLSLASLFATAVCKGWWDAGSIPIVRCLQGAEVMRQLALIGVCRLCCRALFDGIAQARSGSVEVEYPSFNDTRAMDLARTLRAAVCSGFLELSMFRTEFDEGHLLLISEIWGFWTLETVSAYHLDIADHVRRVRLHHSFFRMLCRGTGMSVQTTEVVDAMTRFSSELTTLCPGPIAVVTGSMLNKMQVSRSGSHERFRAFLEEDEARSWLFGYVPPDGHLGLAEP